jgi:26S proteasome regulatory subunit N5
MRWQHIQHSFGDMLRKTPVFSISDEDGEKRWRELHNRVIEHVSQLFK